MGTRLDVAKKQHRERSQPANRQRYGLLEKHKDYVKRSKDFHQKEERLRILRKKASERNPDEYYHGMTSTKSKKGVLISDQARERLSNDAAKLLKTQDSGYIRTVKAHETNKIEKLKNTLGVTIASATRSKRNHVVFLGEDQDVKKFDVSVHFDTPKELLYESTNRLKNSQLDDLRIDELDDDAIQAKEKTAREIEARRMRKRELDAVEKEMNLQRELMKKGPKKKIVKPDGSVTWKWKPQRKR
ncbi:hypothetical protein CANCADRAFT_140139 [Tortispora caseinolytica NRRL Y-17796]|uniref:U3 small nucleolar RNA-associated protein 11 n=1 Tax=Tortispora caseinolytica NRRL Y-17796 TaxID=767744 RepID=A0A1E4TCY7_9ASCO|nr:hypothetical protein CANCADRAFT_140139 [Tortispora caseinolytica NRRL Y-17796]